MYNKTLFLTKAFPLYSQGIILLFVVVFNQLRGIVTKEHKLAKYVSSWQSC